jgi:hypothetical protein
MEQFQNACYFPSEKSGISKINALHIYCNFGIAFTEANEEKSLNLKPYSSLSRK